MTQKPHTPEPWISEGSFIGIPNGKGTFYMSPLSGINQERRESDARRIVACVNACAGVKDPSMYPMAKMLKLADEQRAACFALEKQRDELLAALESNQSRGVRDVIVERRRQINIEGWSSHHDDQHSYGEMSLAAGCYAMFGLCFNAGDPPKYWPWDKQWWKPSDKRRNLVKAAALIIAEIERIDRAAIASVKEELK